MKVSSFWNIVIKIIGLFFVLDLFTILPQFVLTMFQQIYQKEAGAMSIILVVIFLYFLILRVLFFKTEWIIKKLKLNNSFEEENFSLNISRNAILNIAIILIGSIFLINSIPELVYNIQNYYHEKSMIYMQDLDKTPSKSWIMFHLIQCVIGFLVIRNSKKFADFIESKNGS